MRTEPDFALTRSRDEGLARASKGVDLVNRSRVASGWGISKALIGVMFAAAFAGVALAIVLASPSRTLPIEPQEKSAATVSSPNIALATVPRADAATTIAPEDTAAIERRALEGARAARLTADRTAAERAAADVSPDPAPAASMRSNMQPVAAAAPSARRTGS